MGWLVFWVHTQKGGAHEKKTTNLNHLPWVKHESNFSMLPLWVAVMEYVLIFRRRGMCLIIMGFTASSSPLSTPLFLACHPVSPHAHALYLAGSICKVISMLQFGEAFPILRSNGLLVNPQRSTQKTSISMALPKNQTQEHPRGETTACNMEDKTYEHD